ncbi:hypothetical protein NST17_19765 [Caldifermentibacillus hisashii]|uniref:Uncharacterized protein n=1 Tax=Caldifermentibacillus hisashii TaxID=996558 RepID=A0ABU9K2P1_9BACI
MKKQKLNLVLNEIKQSDDPTIMKCTFIVLDFDISRNNVVVEKDVALEGGKTLLNKPIVAYYQQVEEFNTPTDNFGSHQQRLGTNRYGDVIVTSDTVPIGVFVTEGYLLTVNINGENKEVMAADAVLWKTRYPDACDLIVEWYERGININTSCEYLYSNFAFQDGVEYHYSPIYFEGHAVLASEYRGSQEEVLPAYESSKLLSINEINKFNRLVAQAISQRKESEEEGINMKFFKKVFELSHSDIRSLIYAQLDSTLDNNEYSYIEDVYDNYFVVNLYKYDDNDNLDSKYFKYNYTKEQDDTIAIDFESKVEVKIKRDWVNVSEFENMQNELTKKRNELEQLVVQLNEKEAKISDLELQVNSIKAEKESVERQFNETADKLTQLNSTIEELKPFKERFEKEQFEKVLNEKKEYYSIKFNALNAAEKFNSDEVQELIKKAVNETDEGRQAILQLNSMLVDLMDVKVGDDGIIRETAAQRKDLISADDSFESRYAE